MYRSFKKFDKSIKTGWVDNLDEELANSRVKSEKESPVGCEISQLAPVDSDNSNIASTSKEGDNTNTTTIAAEEEKNQDDSDREEEKDQLEKAVDLFADRVTMAGIEDLYKAKSPFDKWLWSMTLIAMIAASIYSCANVAQDYLEVDTIYDHFPVAHYQPLFPNVSICTPLSINKTIFIDGLKISNRSQAYMNKYHIEKDKLIEFALEFWRIDNYPRIVLNKDKTMLHSSLKIIEDTIESISGGLVEYYIRTMPPCGQSLTNCSFYDVPFDCCQAAEQLWGSDRMCYYMDIHRIPELDNITMGKIGSRDDPIKLETTGLLFNVSFDHTMDSYLDEIAQDGFLFDVGRVVYGGSSPTAVPSGADTAITLSATKQKEITECISSNKLPKLKYFDYYDPFGTYAFADQYEKLFYERRAGCTAPFLSYFRQNDSSLPPFCPPQTVIFAKTFGKHDKTDDTIQSADVKKKTDVYKEADQTLLEIDLFHNSLPFCNRWEYKIATASYGYFRLQNQTDPEGEAGEGSESWSRVRILFPTASFMFRKEQARASTYLAICDVGGACGLYIGVSIVSFVHLLVYSIYFVYVYAKKRFDNRAPWT